MAYPGFNKTIRPCVHCGFHKTLYYFVRKSHLKSNHKIFKTCNQCSFNRHNRYILNKQIKNLRTQPFIIKLLHNHTNKLKLSDIKNIIFINKCHDNDYLLGEIINLYYI